MGIIHAFPDEKTLLFREQWAGMYRLSIYYFSKIIVELPVQMVCRPTRPVRHIWHRHPEMVSRCSPANPALSFATDTM